jgi:hypothetical protein
MAVGTNMPTAESQVFDVVPGPLEGRYEPAAAAVIGSTSSLRGCEASTRGLLPSRSGSPMSPGESP